MQSCPHPAQNNREAPTSELLKPERPASVGTFAARSLARFGINRPITTDELAAELGMSAQSIRKRYSQTGSYFELRPVKLPNRRLLWPADALEQLIKG